MADSCTGTALELPRISSHAIDGSFVKPNDELHRKVKLAFIAGKGSGPELAAANRLSYHTVRVWIIQEGWQALKERRQALEQARLEQGLLPNEQVPTEPKNQVEILQAHLKRLDDMLETELDAKNVAQLMRARGDAVEQLAIATTGNKPGTQRPSRSNRRQSYVAPEPIPGPVVSPVLGQDPLEPNG